MSFYLPKRLSALDKLLILSSQFVSSQTIQDLLNDISSMKTNFCINIKLMYELMLAVYEQIAMINFNNEHVPTAELRAVIAIYEILVGSQTD